MAEEDTRRQKMTKRWLNKTRRGCPIKPSSPLLNLIKPIFALYCLMMPYIALFIERSYHVRRKKEDT